MTVSHKSEGHEHATHGHKVTSSEHGEKKEEEEKERKTGITPKLCVDLVQMCSGPKLNSATHSKTFAA